MFKVPRKVGIGLAAATLMVAWLAPAASAGGNGSTTTTQHARGADARGLVEIDFYGPPPPGVTVPSQCWLAHTSGIVSTFGNAVLHDTTNKAGDDWFTTTYTGDAAAYPLVLVNGQPVTDPNTGNSEVDMSGTPQATGHLTTWFGSEDNNQNSVQHATLSFHGVDAQGNPVSLTARFQFAINAQGQPTAVTGAVTC